MLTVEYDRLGLRPGDLVLDMGAGQGRHAFGAIERGGRVIALDLDPLEVAKARDWLKAMVCEGDTGPDNSGEGAAVAGSALALPFADNTFDRVIASEVLEHILDDRSAIAELHRVVRPGGVVAVTVPRWLGELGCWALSDDYHWPAVAGGHVRIYRRRALEQRLSEAGLAPFAYSTTHALHTPYWWLKCAVGVSNDDHPFVKAYHRLLVWDIERQPIATRLTEKVLNPVLGKSIVIYTRRAP